MKRSGSRTEGFKVVKNCCCFHLSNEGQALCMKYEAPEQHGEKYRYTGSLRSLGNNIWGIKQPHIHSIPTRIYMNCVLINVRFFVMDAVPLIILSFAVIPKVKMKLWRYESETTH